MSSDNILYQCPIVPEIKCPMQEWCTDCKHFQSAVQDGRVKTFDLDGKEITRPN